MNLKLYWKFRVIYIFFGYIIYYILYLNKKILYRKIRYDQQTHSPQLYKDQRSKQWCAKTAEIYTRLIWF